MKAYLRELKVLVRYNLRDDLILLRLSLPVGLVALLLTMCFGG